MCFTESSKGHLNTKTCSLFLLGSLYVLWAVQRNYFDFWSVLKLKTHLLLMGLSEGFLKMTLTIKQICKRDIMEESIGNVLHLIFWLS